jgi:cysteine desulfuration protein SufE
MKTPTHADARTLLDELASLRDQQERMARLVRFGGELPPLAVSERSIANRIDGCLSRLWIASEFRDGCCWFRCDSDSMIVKAAAGLLCAYHSGRPPMEIEGDSRDVLTEAGVTQHLTSNRRNGLTRVIGKIAEFVATCRAN